MRIYDGREITAEDKANLCEFIENIENPYDIKELYDDIAIDNPSAAFQE